MKRRRASFFTVGGLKKRTHLVKITLKSPTKTSASSIRSTRERRIIPAAPPNTNSVCVKPESKVPVDPLLCEICNVKFASAEKLKTHLKFSALHELNIKKTTQVPETCSAAGLATISKEKIFASGKSQTSINADDEDPKDLPRLIFRGSKFIIKANMLLECYIYESDPTAKRHYKRFALICYNVDLEQEYSPIYMNGNIVEALAKQLTERNKHPAELNVVVKNEQVRRESGYNFNMSVGDWVLKRLICTVPGGVLLTRLTSDSTDIPLVHGPTIVSGAEVEHTQRRVSISEQFQQKEQELVNEAAQLKQNRKSALDFAEKARDTLEQYTKRFGLKSKQLYSPASSKNTTTSSDATAFGMIRTKSMRFVENLARTFGKQISISAAPTPANTVRSIVSRHSKVHSEEETFSEQSTEADTKTSANF
jgi:hypothetical protein